MSDSPGTRTAGGEAANYLLTGPGWTGDVPTGMKHIALPTRYMVILGRTYADGTEADYKAVNALQAQYKITPLSSWGKPFTSKAPPVDRDPGFSMTDKPQDGDPRHGDGGLFQPAWPSSCAATRPPAAEDAPMLARMAKIGIVPCKPFDMSASSTLTCRRR